MRDICGTQERQAIALARTNSPQTSKDAAEKMVESGELSRQEKMIYEAIQDYQHSNDDFTTKDIAKFMESSMYIWHEDYHKAYEICRRRFSGLFNKSKIILTGERRNGCRVWRLL